MEVSASLDDKVVMILLTKQEAMEFHVWLKKKWPDNRVANELVSALAKTLVVNSSSESRRKT